MRSHSILPIAYDGNSDFDANIVQREKFSCKKRFIILSSKEIPKCSKSYMEFTITKYKTNQLIRHIPLYVGVHKEPTIGYMSSDFCLGSIYYCNPYIYTDKNDYHHPTDFQYIERWKQNADTTMTKVSSKLGAHVPTTGSVIGVGVDMNSNTITIYIDGDKFYSFKPKSFNMNTDPDNYFFAIVNLLDDEDMTGSINYGRIKLKGKPNEYWSLYQYYYDKIPTNQDIDCKAYFGTHYTKDPVNRYFRATIDSKNDIAPIDLSKTHVRDPYLIYSTKNMQYSTNKSMIMSSSDKSQIATLCWPIPTDQKIYFETTTEGCILNIDNDTGLYKNVGIPLFVGLTKNINDMDKYSFTIEMSHEKHVVYKVHSKINNVQRDYDMEDALTPTIPAQPQTVGYIIDLANNQISIYTNGDLFCTVHIRDCDFSKEGTLCYLFFKANNDIFTEDPNAKDREHTIINLGTPDDTFSYPELVDNKKVMSYFYYYNYLIKEEINYYINCSIYTLPAKINFNKNIFCTLYVPEKNIEADKFSPGLNKLWGTYNTISDKEEKKNYQDKNIFDFYDFIEKDLENNKR